jgi:hypothetical protein
MEKQFVVTFASEKPFDNQTKLYAQIKQLVSRIAGAVSVSKKCATVEFESSSKQAKEFYKQGNILTGIDLVPMEDFEMKFNPLYTKDENGNSVQSGNIAKPLCTVIEVGTAQVIGNLSDSELKTAK